MKLQSPKDLVHDQMTLEPEAVTVSAKTLIYN